MFFYMHYPNDRITHTMAFGTPVLAVSISLAVVWQCLSVWQLFGSVCQFGSCLAVSVSLAVVWQCPSVWQLFGSVCQFGSCLAVSVSLAVVWQCLSVWQLFGSVHQFGSCVMSSAKQTSTFHFDVCKWR